MSDERQIYRDEHRLYGLLLTEQGDRGTGREAVFPSRDRQGAKPSKSVCSFDTAALP
jgi:hypothetical protein